MKPFRTKLYEYKLVGPIHSAASLFQGSVDISDFVRASFCYRQSSTKSPIEFQEILSSSAY